MLSKASYDRSYQRSHTQCDMSLKIRPCDIYKEEYSDCTSIKARFHQYFIYGEMVDCSQWKKDFKNCSKWTSDQNIEAMYLYVASKIIN
uniref:Uncharacterized protein n=1 Tax=Timema genevievae TaxID=629358 RepID=A0A7R9JTE9_TIMGE|nr:unnamed protein product [Timema genevievae]